MPRLFIAVDMPENARTSLVDLRCDLAAARWVPVEQLHLTLRFLGEVDQDTFQLIKRALAEVTFNPFSLTLCGVGHFPRGGHPRVLWVGMEPCPALLKLQQTVEEALARIAIPKDDRRFSPHITLARLQDTSKLAVADFEARHEGFSCLPFEVRNFFLYSSVLSRSGATHHKEATY